MTPVISITPAPPGIIELNEVSGSVETNSSSKRDPVPRPTRQFATTNPNPIFQSESITGWQWPGPSWLPKTSDPVRRATVSFRIQTGLRDLIQPADKRPTKKAAKVEAGVVSPGVFLLPSPLAPRVIRAIPSGRDSPRPGHRSSSRIDNGSNGFIEIWLFAILQIYLELRKRNLERSSNPGT